MTKRIYGAVPFPGIPIDICNLIRKIELKIKIAEEIKEHYTFKLYSGIAENYKGAFDSITYTHDGIFDDTFIQGRVMSTFFNENKIDPRTKKRIPQIVKHNEIKLPYNIWCHYHRECVGQFRYGGQTYFDCDFRKRVAEIKERKIKNNKLFEKKFKVKLRRRTFEKPAVKKNPRFEHIKV